MDAMYVRRHEGFDEVSHEVSHIKLVRMAWKKHTVKPRIDRGLRGRNEELQAEMCGIHKYLGLQTLAEDAIQKSLSGDVGKRMEIALMTYPEFSEYNTPLQISLQLLPLPTENRNHCFHTDQHPNH